MPPLQQQNVELPSREQQLLKRAKVCRDRVFCYFEYPFHLQKMYEDRHNKAALKIIDQILTAPNCAEHGGYCLGCFSLASVCLPMQRRSAHVR